MTLTVVSPAPDGRASDDAAGTAHALGAELPESGCSSLSSAHLRWAGQPFTTPHHRNTPHPSATSIWPERAITADRKLGQDVALASCSYVVDE